jgi:nitrate/nitrite-specific signal transduction histidine kinase
MEYASMTRHLESPVRNGRNLARRQTVLEHPRLGIASPRPGSAEAGHEIAQLANELHDRVAQSLWGLDAELAELAKLIDCDPALARQRLQPVRQHLAEAYHDVRLALGALRTLPPIDSTLPEAVMSCVERFADRSGIDARVVASCPAIALSKFVQLQVLAILGQALQNVWKHASASTVLVSIYDLGEEWQMEVSDNGRGMALSPGTEAEPPVHYGLTIMRERAQSFSGSVVIYSNIDHGVTVRVRIPKRVDGTREANLACECRVGG